MTIDVQQDLKTERTRMIAVDEQLAPAYWELYSDKKLHEFVSSDPMGFDQALQRCKLWSTRRSPDKKELWLNWLAFSLDTNTCIGHFQAGVDSQGLAEIAYTVAHRFQRMGFAFECTNRMMAYLKLSLFVKEIKICSDSENLASHQLAKKLGLLQISEISNADFFKGLPRNEFVFHLKF